jgi:hypothetical protein
MQSRDWLSRKRNPVRPLVSPVPAKPIFKEGMLEGRLDPHVQFQSPMETRSKWEGAIIYIHILNQVRASAHEGKSQAFKGFTWFCVKKEKKEKGFTWFPMSMLSKPCCEEHF